MVFSSLFGARQKQEGGSTYLMSKRPTRMKEERIELSLVGGANRIRTEMTRYKMRELKERTLRQFTWSRGKSAGRNSSGRITLFHRGGGKKRLLRGIDIKRKSLNLLIRISLIVALVWIFGMILERDFLQELFWKMGLSLGGRVLNLLLVKWGCAGWLIFLVVLGFNELETSAEEMPSPLGNFLLPTGDAGGSAASSNWDSFDEKVLLEPMPSDSTSSSVSVLGPANTEMINEPSGEKDGKNPEPRPVEKPGPSRQWATKNVSDLHSEEFRSLARCLTASPSDGEEVNSNEAPSQMGESSANPTSEQPTTIVSDQGAGPSNLPRPFLPYPFQDTEEIGGDTLGAIRYRLLEYAPKSHPTWELGHYNAQDIFELKVEIINLMAQHDPSDDWMRWGARALDNPRTNTGEQPIWRLMKFRDDLRALGSRSETFSFLKGRIEREKWRRTLRVYYGGNRP